MIFFIILSIIMFFFCLYFYLNTQKLKQEVSKLELDIKEAWNILGEIIGATYKEELLDEMFKRFCLGK